MVVNSASRWLLVPFIAGAVVSSRAGAMVTGGGACLLAFVGYTLTAQLRGYGTGKAIFGFWAACALLVGPIFTAAGHLWRHGSSGLRGLGPGLLAAAFASEGIGSFAHTLHHDLSAEVWVAIAVLIELTMTRRPAERAWLIAALPVGFAVQIVVVHLGRAF